MINSITMSGIILLVIFLGIVIFRIFTLKEEKLDERLKKKNVEYCKIIKKTYDNNNDLANARIFNKMTSNSNSPVREKGTSYSDVILKEIQKKRDESLPEQRIMNIQKSIGNGGLSNGSFN